MFKKLFSKSVSDDMPADRKGNTVKPTFDESGLLFPMLPAAKLAALPLDDQLTVSYLGQLDEEGYLSPAIEQWVLPWHHLYELLANEEHRTSLPLLGLPPVSTVTPLLASRGGLADLDFKITIKGWRQPDGKTITELARVGAVTNVQGKTELLSAVNWVLLQAIQAFSRRQSETPGEMTNQIGWAEIRKLAKKAHAGMDGFLMDTIVLRPDSLQLDLRKSELQSNAVIEIAPEFEDQPSGWLDQFDRYQQVQDRYHISNEDGSLTHILVSPEVKTVLETIKRMPGRRVSGDDALAVIKNPYALLGDDAVKVLDPAQYEKSLADAGIHFHRFSIDVELSPLRKIDYVRLTLSPRTVEPLPDSIIDFKQPSHFAPFVAELRVKLAAERPCGFWEGYELELGDFDLQALRGLESLLERWQQEAAGVEFTDVLDLEKYGERVKGIGVAEDVSSPFLAKGKSEEWLSPELLNHLGMDGDLLAKWDSSEHEHFEIFSERIEEAISQQKEDVVLPGIELPMGVKTAIELRDEWAKKFKKSESEAGAGGEPPPEKAVLLIEHNINETGYAASREEALLLGHAAQPAVPEALKESVLLREHQRKGVAWLQHLFESAPTHATGCLLGDDMGLGKTLQLLTFIIHYIEQYPEGDPVLIVAPVSLLDNWERELRNFFYADTLVTLKLYGSTLTDAKFKKHEIPNDLRMQGILNLLRPGWRGNARIVLTTYETLRDQVFSVARQHWAIVVCDEAQKIKNPAALVTQAAKAIPARFRVACTGTPVENSLTDLWCLFDFIQPGLLGSLNEFGRTYRRPIESETEQDKIALQRLRALVEPQLLRRTKADVAKDLPAKLEDGTCRSLNMATFQERLYKSAIAAYQQKKVMFAKASEQNVAILGLLHTLKMVCAHPHSVRPEGALLDVSPKMRWLMESLELIQKKNEKVIVFTELRDIQRAVQLAVLAKFGFSPIIINGDTNASSERGESRQGLIDKFQQQPGFGVIILSTTAVGFGVNVQAANHVVHFTRTWNPAKEDQATDRAYRIGQTKDVHVYYPTVTAKDFQTFEATLDQLLSKKRELAGDMLNGSSDISLHELAVTAT
ncbi:type I Zorya anti-phage system protein ZorD [Silvimonas amylolytica]|uniref:Superfamily II DNA or RNA helicase, SNF2 family n=1 Tax=Silvimonas amylolytica TaxID=449663 RepID=A0ABQ2PNE7_9NEIS|nr:type I Zorya anti-phage system protein ZorD [Silvimonas amylolytica]GGP26843.1 hypothetical protein GCM10010971_26620 [Silvimonas amylolytica]